MQILEEAYESFLKIAEEYASDHNLSDSDKKELLEMIGKAYTDKKIEYFLTEKLSRLSQFMNFSFSYSIKEPKDRKGKMEYSIAYVKHLKQMVTNG